MIDKRWMNITTCNNEVQTLSNFFSNGSCAVGSNTPTFNTLGDNGDSACRRCANTSDSRRYCTNSDPYAGSAGAMVCLDNIRQSGGKGVAFVRGDTLVNWAANNPAIAGQYRLLCQAPQAE